MIANHKGEVPVVLLLLPFVLGNGFGIYYPVVTATKWLLAVFLLLSIIFIILNLNYSRLKLYKSRWIGGLLITFLLFLSGWIGLIRHSELNSSDHFSKLPAQFLVVKINNEPVLKNGLLRFTADVEASINKGKKCATSGTLLVTTKDSGAKKLYYGDELLVPAKYNAVDPPFIPAEFNYKKYMADKNIFYQAFLVPKQYVVLNTGRGNPVISYALRLRQRLVEKLKNNMHDSDAVAVASTLILGYRADLSNDVLEAYSKTGTLYVLSVSGAQVGIIYFLLILSLTFLDRYKHGRLIKAFIIISFIWYYALLTGFSIAVCRAVVMVSMITIGKTFNRYINTLNILAAAAFLLLVYNPLFIAEPGFQLSFAAVSGLVVFQPLIYQLLKFKNKWADRLWSVCSFMFTVQAITFPFSAYYFHQLPVYFLISNLFVIVPSAVIMYAGILFLMLPQIPVLSSIIGFILENATIMMNKGLAIIEHIPYSGIGKIWLTKPECLLLYAVIICFFYFLYDKKGWVIKLVLVFTLLLCLSLSVKRFNNSQSNNIAWLNLKKHYGIVFKRGNEVIIFSDLKAGDKIYQYSIQPYLDSCQVSDVHVLNLNEDVSTGWIIKKYNFVQFLNKRIFIFNGKSQNNLFPPDLKTDYIYLTGNPDNLQYQINNKYGNEMLVVDGSNGDYFVSRAEQVAKIKRIAYKILKRNNSLISVSN